MEDLMIYINDVSKKYMLGQIGGTTLRDELQRKKAKRRGEEDPTSIIGQKKAEENSSFLALDGITLKVKPGERVGIIGHNGAGKSTLLKLLCRVTAPTSGEIGLNGRIASMLEVGTGFHPELTGRENIYMNGAILGMTRAEIDKKLEDIIDFSECRQFIDTPVKRYSSGMYVKLAFSVAAHLDSEIMIMDEVLAVGDMAFQKKCLEKMNKVSEEEGRTILYVSHNMNTIRQLCDRCVVMDHGKLIFDGDVEKAIDLYMSAGQDKCETDIVYTEHFRPKGRDEELWLFKSLRFLNKKTVYGYEDDIDIELKAQSKKDLEDISFRFEIHTNEKVVCTSLCKSLISLKKGKEYSLRFNFPTKHIAAGKYYADIVAYQYDSHGNELLIDGVYPGFIFEIENMISDNNHLVWLSKWWGNIRAHDVDLKEVREEE